MAIITLAEYKALVGTSATTNDTQIAALIPEVQGDVIALCNDAFGTELTPVVERWPSGIKLYAAQMITFLLAAMADSGLMKRENITSYDYIKADLGVNGYPISIEKALINKWRKVACGYTQRKTQYRNRRLYSGEVITKQDPGFGIPDVPVEY